MPARTGRAWIAALALALPLVLPIAAGNGAPRVHVVVIEGMRFIPETVELKAGDTVVWQNRDPFPHTATGSAGGPASPDLAAGASWKYVARKTGRFPYLCTLHRTMRGNLVVK